MDAEALLQMELNIIWLIKMPYVGSEIKKIVSKKY
jgi:hypothetical protein